MNYNNIIPYYGDNMYRNVSVRRPYPNNYRPRPNNRYPNTNNFLLPFALGFVSSPLIFGATRPKPPYYAPFPGYFPYY